MSLSVSTTLSVDIVQLFKPKVNNQFSILVGKYISGSRQAGNSRYEKNSQAQNLESSFTLHFLHFGFAHIVPMLLRECGLFTSLPSPTTPLQSFPDPQVIYRSLHSPRCKLRS